MSEGKTQGERTYSVEEVGKIIHQASSEPGASPEPAPQAAGGQHERVTWDELREIAADVGISEAALERATEASIVVQERAGADDAKAAVPDSPTTDLAVAGRTLTRDVAITGGALVVVGGAGVAAGVGTAFMWPVLLLAPVALLARSVWLLAPPLAGLVQNKSEIDNQATSNKQYRITFGEGTVDLTKIEREGPTEVVDVQVHFGEVLIRLDPAIPYVIETSVAFGEIKAPPATSTAHNEAPRLVVRVKVRFGSAKIVLI